MDHNCDLCCFQKTIVAVLDQMVDPHWLYLPKRQENYETEEEREAIEGVWNTISDDPLNYHFYYHILEGDEGGRPPKIMASDGHKEMENKYFNLNDKSCLHAIAKSNNKVRFRPKDDQAFKKSIGEICNIVKIWY